MWWMELRLHSSAIVCMPATNTQAGVNTALRFFCFFFFPHHSFRERSLFVLLFMVSKKCAPPSSAWPSVAMATHGSREWWLVRRARHRLSQKKYLSTLRRCLYPYCHAISCIKMRYPYSLLAATTTPKYKKTSHQGFKRPFCPSAFHWLCLIDREMHSTHTIILERLECPTLHCQRYRVCYILLVFWPQISLLAVLLPSCLPLFRFLSYAILLLEGCKKKKKKNRNKNGKNTYILTNSIVDSNTLNIQ